MILRSARALLALLVPSLIALAPWACRSAAPPAKPSIVLVTFDTLRLDHVGAYREGQGHTPRMDEFSERALIHENAFTTMPTTAPSHASLFTGLHPYEHGVLQNGMRLPESVAVERSLPLQLKRRGYDTSAFVTSSVFGPDVMGLRGLDVYDAPGPGLRPGVDAVASALRWLDGDPPPPVFLWVHLFDPHSPYGAADEKKQDFPIDFASYGWVDRSRYADGASRSRMAALYARGVLDADTAFGMLLDGIEGRLGPDPTIVVVADHGEFLDERLDSDGFAYGHGSILDEPVLRIPLMIAGPGVRPGRSRGAVSIRDLYTTILETAGIGDGDADDEGRRDLRAASAERRLVTAERRTFSQDVRSSRRIDPGALERIRRFAVAVTDGEKMLVLGEDGTPSDSSVSVEDELVAAAEVRLAERQGRAVSPGELDIDEETVKALRDLGYIQ